MKKLMALILALSLLLSFTACSGGQDESTTGPTSDPTENVQDETDPTSDDPDVETSAPDAPADDTLPDDPVSTTGPDTVTDPTGTEPSAPAVTEPDTATEPDSATEPGVQTPVTEPSVPESTGSGTEQPDTGSPSVKPTEPAPTVTVPSTPTATEPKPTVPAATEPKPTEPAATEPKPTVPTACSHNYVLTSSKAATCTSAGQATYTCSKCGDSYQQTVGAATGHQYSEATCTQPQTCRNCGATTGSAKGHSYNSSGRCTSCGAIQSQSVEITVSVRSNDGEKLANVTVSIYVGGSSTPAATGVTGTDGLAHLTLSELTTYQVVLSNLPAFVKANSSYTFSSTRANINLPTQAVLDPLDHSRAQYAVGSAMADFTLTDTDGNVYTLYDLLEEKELVVLDFWYCTCVPCKNEFPYFEKALDLYGDRIELLALNPYNTEQEIIDLRKDLGSTFPMLRDTVNLYKGFNVTAFPTTIIIDSSGTIKYIKKGAFSSETQFLNQIEKYLK